MTRAVVQEVAREPPMGLSLEMVLGLEIVLEQNIGLEQEIGLEPETCEG